ncbi:MAG: hypothetical protein ACI4J2_11005 [Ruminococcus sp.]|nr:hypothetical protein [Oscillospiraceae bacterium]
MAWEQSTENVVYAQSAGEVYDAVLKAAESLKYVLESDNRKSFTAVFRIGKTFFTKGEVLTVTVSEYLSSGKTSVRYESNSVKGTEKKAKAKNQKNISDLVSAVNELLSV